MTKRKQEQFVTAMNLESARVAGRRDRAARLRKHTDASLRYIFDLCVRSARVHQRRQSASEIRDVGPNEP